MKGALMIVVVDGDGEYGLDLQLLATFKRSQSARTTADGRVDDWLEMIKEE